MAIEIELKFPVDSLESVEVALAERDVIPGAAVQQKDQYFAHPQRDFSQTDEALRVRKLDGSCEVTYKGPKLDDVSKTRREIEFALPAGDADQAVQLFQELGFRPVATVVKQRRKAKVTWHRLTVTVALDAVEDVGFFVELEVLSGTDRFQSIRQELFRLAESLGLGHTERRSYLELLLLRRA